jgi:hypothetical protein
MNTDKFISKYKKYKTKYIKLKNKIGGGVKNFDYIILGDYEKKLKNKKKIYPWNKFKEGEKVKRIKYTRILNNSDNKSNNDKKKKEEKLNKLGEMGIIKMFKNRHEFPPGSGNIIPYIYVVKFKDGTILDVPYTDLISVSDEINQFEIKMSDNLGKIEESNKIINASLYDIFNGIEIAELLLSISDMSIYFSFEENPMLILKLKEKNKNLPKFIFSINTNTKKYIFKKLSNYIILNSKIYNNIKNKDNLNKLFSFLNEVKDLIKLNL